MELHHQEGSMLGGLGAMLPRITPKKLNFKAPTEKVNEVKEFKIDEQEP